MLLVSDEEHREFKNLSSDDYEYEIAHCLDRIQTLSPFISNDGIKKAVQKHRETILYLKEKYPEYNI